MSWKNFSRFWDRPEIKLKRKLRENPLFPFKETDDVYCMEIKNVSFYVGIFTFFVSFVVGFGYWYQRKRFSNELFDTFFIFSMVLSLRLIQYNWQTRRIEIEKDGEQYYFYIGRKLVYTGKIYNIYIRLRGQRSSNGSTYYRIILNGFNIEEQDITSMSTNKNELEKLARTISGRLNINYFDSDDVSIGHIVRHVNPISHYLKPADKRPTRTTKRFSVTRASLDAFY
uniref:transmembrane protein 249-like n=1 Tax=Styela clava TaxID=7725 RepID=UPI00193A5193|nr:transmembrane protein 249-like [Styela clava]